MPDAKPRLPRGWLKEGRRLGLRDSITRMVGRDVEARGIPAVLMAAGKMSAGMGLDPRADAERVLSLLHWDWERRPNRYVRDPATDAIPPLTQAELKAALAAAPRPGPEWRVDLESKKPDTLQMAMDCIRHYNLLFELQSERLWRQQSGWHSPLTDTELDRLITDTYSDTDIHRRTINEITYKIRTRAPAIDPGEWDADPDIINCKNGVLNIDTGELLPHDQNMRSRLQLNADYDPNARPPPEFARYLATSLDRDPEKIFPVLEFLAQAITPHRPLHKFYIWEGPNNSGKSTLLNLAAALVNRRAMESSSLQQLGGPHGGETLEGTYLCFGWDMSTERPVESVSLIKAAVYGEPVPINPKGRPHYTLMPRALFAFSMNGMPKIPKDDGLNERMVIVQFHNTFEGESPRRDPDLIGKLTTPRALSGILNVLLVQLRRIRATRRPRYEKTAAEAYAAYQDIVLNIGAFETWLDFGKINGRVAKTELWELYRTYCRQHRNKPIKHGDFDSWLQTKGCVTTSIGPKTKRIKAWLGVEVGEEGRRHVGVVPAAHASLDQFGNQAPPPQPSRPGPGEDGTAA